MFLEANQNVQDESNPCDAAQLTFIKKSAKKMEPVIFSSLKTRRSPKNLKNGFSQSRRRNQASGDPILLAPTTHPTIHHILRIGCRKVERNRLLKTTKWLAKLTCHAAILAIHLSLGLLYLKKKKKRKRWWTREKKK